MREASDAFILKKKVANHSDRSESQGLLRLLTKCGGKQFGIVQGLMTTYSVTVEQEETWTGEAGVVHHDSRNIIQPREWFESDDGKQTGMLC